ncbi:chorion protein S15 [Drosophila busckii]|uniref:chorion protein S15 n=1 Tax=Drosophila busckii TaxID=30019 RepID=UPI00083EBFDE|nr:chorion protein S15 [Drosophila busckii]
MKFLIAFASLALFAVINASPYGGHSSYGGGHSGYGNIAYVQDQGYGGSYHGGYAQPLRSISSNPRAAAAAAASSADLNQGYYNKQAVIGYEIDGSWNGPSRGYGSRGGYGSNRGGYGRSSY